MLITQSANLSEDELTVDTDIRDRTKFSSLRLLQT